MAAMLLFRPGLGHFVADVVFVNAADVADRFSANSARRDDLDISEPPIRVEAFLPCLIAQANNPRGAGIVGSEAEKPTICFVDVI